MQISALKQGYDRLDYININAATSYTHVIAI